jgi:hypothetical protein
MDQCCAPLLSQIPCGDGSGSNMKLLMMEEGDVVNKVGWRLSGVRGQTTSHPLGDIFRSKAQGKTHHRHVLLLAGDIELQRDFVVISIFAVCLSVISFL